VAPHFSENRREVNTVQKIQNQSGILEILNLPMIPLRDTVLFPGTMMPFLIGREQDHYLDTAYDLSRVLFIATANVPYNIPAPLYDRMEILQLPGYTEEEKIQIASRFLVPKQLKAHGLTRYKILFRQDAIPYVIRHYTREAGVRNLEREIASVCRNIAKRIALADDYPKNSGYRSTARISRSGKIPGPRSRKRG
jgi:ATP-dependent Lon protease